LVVAVLAVAVAVLVQTEVTPCFQPLLQLAVAVVDGVKQLLELMVLLVVVVVVLVVENLVVQEQQHKVMTHQTMRAGSKELAVVVQVVQVVRHNRVAQGCQTQ
jgi:hypothetical protein